MKDVSSLFGDERLDADLASILSLDNKNAQSDLVAPERTLHGAWKDLQLSRQASATVVVSLGCALLASTALLIRPRPPAKPLIAAVVPMTSRLAPRQVAELAPAAEELVPSISVDHERQSSAVRHPPHNLVKLPFAPDIDATSRHPARTEVMVSSLAVFASGTLTPNNNPAIEHVRSPAHLASNENSASPTRALLNTELGVAGEPSTLDQIGSSLQLKRARRASIDAMRILRRQ